MKKKGYFPAKIDFKTFLFTFKGIIKDKKVKEVIRVKESENKDKRKVFVKRFNNFGYDWVPGKGRIKRPSFSFKGILSKILVKKDFSFTPIRSRLPEKFGKLFFYTTDCPLSTGGILSDYDTSKIFLIQVIKAKGERKTLWEVFGE